MDREPRYRVLNPHPSIKDILKNANAADILQVVAITAGCAAIGYATGHTIRKPNAICAGLLGFIGGGIGSGLDSRNRLLGYRNNGYPVEQQIRLPKSE